METNRIRANLRDKIVHVVQCMSQGSSEQSSLKSRKVKNEINVRAEADRDVEHSTESITFNRHNDISSERLMNLNFISRN